MNKCLSENVPADKIKGKKKKAPDPRVVAGRGMLLEGEKVTGVNYKKYLVPVWRGDSRLAR